jgi:hypothetical protein
MRIESVDVEAVGPPKKFRAVLTLDGGKICTVRFGHVSPTDPRNDFPHHKDLARRRDYLRRHRAREDWSRAGACTAGFWSRWMLWGESEPTAIRDELQKKLGAPVHFAPGVAQQLRQPYNKP